MKKFIFGVMLLVSLLGIIGCSNPSNSDGSDGSENVVYTVKNSTGSEINLSYKKKSVGWSNIQTVPVNGIYEIPANDAEKGIDNWTGGAAIFLKIEEETQEYRMVSVEGLKKGIQITQYDNSYYIEVINR